MRRRGGKEEEEEEEEGVIIKVVVVGWIDWRGKPRRKKKGCDDDVKICLLRRHSKVVVMLSAG